MKAVIGEVDKLKKDGKTDDAALLIHVLNKAPTTAYNLSQVGLDSLTDEEKKDIRSGKASQIIKSHLTEEKTTKAKNFNKVMKELYALENIITDTITEIDNFNKDEAIQIKLVIKSIKKIIPDLEIKLEEKIKDIDLSGLDI